MSNNGPTNISLTKKGSQDWTRLLGGIDSRTVISAGIDGSIYSAGYGEIRNYNADGTKNWTRTINSEVNAVTTGLDGSIYIAGHKRGGFIDGSIYTPSEKSGDFDGQPIGVMGDYSYWSNSTGAFINKLNPDGSNVWITLLGEGVVEYHPLFGTQLIPYSSEDAATALCTGIDGSIYIAGHTWGDLEGQTNSGGPHDKNTDAFISKLNPDGSKAWTRLVGAYGSERAEAVTTGLDGSIYIAGHTSRYGDLDGHTNSGDTDVFISKFNPDGFKIWTRLLGGKYSDGVSAITTGRDGSIYITGYTSSPELDDQSNPDSRRNTGYSVSSAFISKFNADSSIDWTRFLGSDINSALPVTNGSDGSIYISGTRGGNVPLEIGDYKDLYISKLNSDGSKEWIVDSDLNLDPTDPLEVFGITSSADGSIYITGSKSAEIGIHLTTSGFDAFITKFNDNISAINENINAGTLIGTLSTSDQDVSDTHTYRLVSGDGDTDNSFFTIDDNQLKINYSPDYETKSSYKIRIKTTNSSELSYEKIIELSVNNMNDNPQDISLSASIINENIKEGSIISILSTSDQDVSDTHTYKFVSGDGDDDNSFFTIDGNQLKINSSPDYETKSSYNIRLQTTDSSELSYEKAITIRVNDESVVTISGTDSNETLNGTTDNDNIKGGGGSDVIDGGAGDDTVTYTGYFNDYTITKTTTTIQITDIRITSPDGTDTLKNIEYIQFADQLIEESKVDVVKTYSGEFSDYKFYNKSNGVYQIKTDSGFDDITGLPLLTFTGESTTSSFRDVSAIVDIKGTFDQVTGLNTDSGKMFRLYNASFKRLPDPDGLKYWIGKYSSGENDDRTVASSFLVSDEFKQRYGQNISDTTYVNNLYKNVLGRLPDSSGLNYWLGQLNSGAETRYEVLLGFAESTENKALFTEMTGFG
jgi:hypothetical protein